MLPQLHSFGIDKPPWSYFVIQFRALFTKEVTVITFNKADFHTLSFFGLGFVAFISKVFAYFHFRIIPQRENTTPQYILPQLPKKIRLVFLVIISGYYINIPVSLFQAGIMSGSNPGTTQLVRPLRQDTKLK